MLSVSKLTFELAISGYKTQVKYRRFLLPVFLIVLLAQGSTRELTQGVLADAFIQVSAFVAATLALYYGLMNTIGQHRLAQWVQRYPFGELVFCSFLGALPGCGGAIIVITQYTKGRISFGAVVAVLTATMGDAAFLLLAQRPSEGLLVIALTMGTGIVSGWLVNKLHHNDFMRPQIIDDNHYTCHYQKNAKKHKVIANISVKFWKTCLFPALCLGMLTALQVDINGLFLLPQNTVEILGTVLCFIAVALWAFSSTGDSYEKITSEERTHVAQHWMLKVAQDTQFVTSWVVAAFLLFELAQFWFNLDLLQSLREMGPLVILYTVIIGLLPGCGPQILITSIYLQSGIPFSAQLANAISNDGDALFPAIALAPKAALVATLYSAIPAILVGYGYFWLFE